jgi:DNA-binding IscR family transcriptional regulator
VICATKVSIAPGDRGGAALQPAIDEIDVLQIIVLFYQALSREEDYWW